MKIGFMRSVTLLLAAAACAGSAGPILAQGNYPAGPVKIVIGFGPGSGTDIMARMLAEEMRMVFNQPFLVDNRPGAAAQIAATAVAKAPADGYTLFFTSNTSHSVNPHVPWPPRWPRFAPQPPGGYRPGTAG